MKYETWVDAARQHFLAVAASPRYTRGARNEAAKLAREATEELEAINAGHPLHELRRIAWPVDELQAA